MQIEDICTGRLTIKIYRKIPFHTPLRLTLIHTNADWTQECVMLISRSHGCSARLGKMAIIFDVPE